MVDRSALGRALPTVHAEVEKGRLRFFLDTMGEKNPVFRDPSAAQAAGLDATPIPPTYLFCLEMMDSEDPFAFLEMLDVDIGRILHGEQSFDYHAPVVAGDRLAFESRISDIVDKKGGALTLVTVETRVTSQTGRHVADVMRSIVVRN